MSNALNKRRIEAEADLLVSFVNTRDLETGDDALADPERLSRWVADRSGEFVPVPDADSQARLLALRESLRALVLSNNGGAVGEEELEPLREAAERSRYRTSISTEGEVALVPARADLSGFEARLLLALERVQSQGAGARLKACVNPACHWAFYDNTRNRSRTWCSMEECGNREKTRRYRERRRSR
ncbi:MAG TPA: CGNR zinc finger domain-containing protein, partial [Solirubrobacterales bacterium]|nr:CGNR zinc finger domain-containing protein [Solirubrobacterales bacterium]